MPCTTSVQCASRPAARLARSGARPAPLAAVHRDVMAHATCAVTMSAYIDTVAVVAQAGAVVQQHHDAALALRR